MLRSEVEAVLSHLNIPAWFKAAQDPEIEDDMFELNSRVSISFNYHGGLVVLENADETCTTWRFITGRDLVISLRSMAVHLIMKEKCYIFDNIIKLKDFMR